MISAAKSWLAADERPWNKDIDWEGTERGLWGRIRQFIRPYVVVVLLTALVTSVLQWSLSGVRMRPEEREMLASIAQTRMAVPDMALLAGFLVSNGVLRRHSPEDLVKVVAAVQATADPHMRLWQLAWTTERFREDVDGYVATVEYVAGLPRETRQWLIGRPAAHWVELSQRFSNIGPYGADLIHARQKLIEEEAYLRRELDVVQRQLAQRRTCRAPLQEVILCADAASAAGRSTSPAQPQRR